MTDFSPIARTGLPPVKPASASLASAELPRAAVLGADSGGIGGVGLVALCVAQMLCSVATLIHDT
jgi:hypothetical protein